MAEPTDTDEDDTFYPIEDADDEAEDCLGKRMPPNASKSHWGEGSIFYAAGCIGGQSGSLGRVKGGNSFDQADGSHGDQILLIRGLGIVFFHDVGDQTKVAFNQNISGIDITF